MDLGDVKDIALEKTIQIDLSSLNQSNNPLGMIEETESPKEESEPVPVAEAQATEVSVEETPVETTSEDKELFKSCLLAEVKRKKGAGELTTPEEVQDFCRKRMSEFQNGTFDYPDDIKLKMKKVLETQNMLNGLKKDDVVVRKVA